MVKPLPARAEVDEQFTWKRESVFADVIEDQHSQSAESANSDKERTLALAKAAMKQDYFKRELRIS